MTAKKVNEVTLFGGIVDSLDYNITPISPTQNDQLVKVSIDLLTKLFLHKSALTSKNKLQLIKHFESYSIVNIAKETPHTGRLIKLAVTCLSLVKEHCRVNISDYEQSPLDPQALEKLSSIKNNLLKF